MLFALAYFVVCMVALWAMAYGGATLRFETDPSRDLIMSAQLAKFVAVLLMWPLILLDPYLPKTWPVLDFVYVYVLGLVWGMGAWMIRAQRLKIKELQRQRGKARISPVRLEELYKKAELEKAQEGLAEIHQVRGVSFHQYICGAQAILNNNIFPSWRVNKDRTSIVLSSEPSRQEAFPITFRELAASPALWVPINFDPEVSYFKHQFVIVFYCQRCLVYVVKAGGHRLLECAYHKRDPDVLVYQVSSADWKRSTMDMKNFCQCPAVAG